jgi:prepilin-type N-terminal cleavage/methylation domain-containing protein
MKQQKAFTIIELLIVVLILGTLATIAIPMFKGMIIKARLTQLLIVYNRIQKGVDLYITEYGYDANPYLSGGASGLGLYPDELPEDNIFKYEIRPLYDASRHIFQWEFSFYTMHATPIEMHGIGFAYIAPQMTMKWWLAEDHPWAVYFSDLLKKVMPGVTIEWC